MEGCKLQASQAESRLQYLIIYNLLLLLIHIVLQCVALCIYHSYFSQVAFGIKSKKVGLLSQRINAYETPLHTIKFPSIMGVLLCTPMSKIHKCHLPTALPTECVTKPLDFTNVVRNRTPVRG